jgi:sortase A
MRSPVKRIGRLVERLAWLVGTACVCAWGVLSLSSTIGARNAIREFEAQRTAGEPAPSANTPDMSLWSPARVRGWQLVSTQPAPTALAVLKIARLRLTVPVFEGTDDATLDRGAGHIEGTALPGADGNSGIAGHRDGFFRVLKDIVPGDVMELETLRTTVTYRVERTWIVAPDDVSVLDPTPSGAITLVTCYPFYFIGSAPQRFIVRARAATDTQR